MKKAETVERFWCWHELALCLDRNLGGVIWRGDGGIMKVVGRLGFVVFLTFVGLISFVSAQQAKGPATAPVPLQIGAAQKVFISNGGGESFETVIDQTVFNGGSDRPYNEFYAAMKAWSRYELVSSPADADLIFEVSWVLTDTGLRLPVLGQIRVLIIDLKTHVTLWNLIEYVRGAVLLGNRDKNFDQAMNTIMGRLKVLTGSAVAQGSK
jgi:hypothetical protein